MSSTDITQNVWTSLDFLHNQIKNALLHKLSSAPQSPVEGQTYYNTTDHKPYVYDGTNWVVLTPVALTPATAETLGGVKVGSGLHMTGDNSDTLAIDYTNVSLSDFAAPSADLAMGSHKITGLAAGVANTDAVNKGQMDAAIAAAAPGVDNVTIETFDNTSGGGSDHDVRVKDGGLTAPKFNANSLSLGANETAANAKLVSQTKVSEDIVNERSTTATLTYKTIDADNNTISNLELDNFKTGVVVTTIRPATAAQEGDPVASDSSVPTEKAIRTAIDNAVASTAVDGVTIQRNVSGELETIRATASDIATGTDTNKATTAKAVKDAIDAALTSVLRYRGAWTIARESATGSQTTGSGLTEIAVNLATFKSEADPSDTADYEFTYDGSNWSLESTNVDLADYGITFTGTPQADDVITVAYVKTTSDYSGLSGFLPIKKGDTFVVNGTGPVIIDSVEYNPGDHIIFNTAVSASSGLITASIDKVDSTESADIVRLSSTQTLTNKTIDASSNTISNLSAANFDSTKIQLGTSETAAAAIIPSKAWVEAQITTGVTVDNVTIERDQTNGLQVKDGGLTVAKFNSSAVSTSIAATSTASNNKVATEKAVRDLHDGIPAETMTLTNKTFDANGTGNSLSNVEVADFASSAIVTSTTGIAASADDCSDSKLPTEKAVRQAITSYSINLYSITNDALTVTNGSFSWKLEGKGNAASIQIRETATGASCWLEIVDDGTDIYLKGNYSGATVPADTFTVLVLK